MTATELVLAWSGGKDCLMALQRLRADPRWQLVGLLSTINQTYERIAMHGIRRGTLRAQTEALNVVPMDWLGSNEAYERAHAAALAEAQQRWRPPVRPRTTLLRGESVLRAGRFQFTDFMPAPDAHD